MEQVDPRYPVGRFNVVLPLTALGREEAIAEIGQLPALLADRLERLDSGAQEATYRDGGWSVRQIVHHIADSHINAYVRCRLALTENRPTIKPYDEASWADLPDVAATDPTVSLKLIEALHIRWTALLRALDEQDFAREIIHPEHGRAISLDELVATYAWHGRHHLAHIDAAMTTGPGRRTREGL